MLFPTLLCCVLLVKLGSPTEALDVLQDEALDETKETELSRKLAQFDLTRVDEADVNDETEEQLKKEEKDRKDFSEIDNLLVFSTEDYHRHLVSSRPESVEWGKRHRKYVIKAKRLLERKKVPSNLVAPLLKRGFGPKVDCNQNLKCNRYARYRTADGSCNNLYFPARGMAMTPFRRWLYPAYDDGMSEPREFSVVRHKSGRRHKLPSARSVSVAVHVGSTVADENKKFTQMLMEWGQFLDHDFTSTPLQESSYGPGSSPVACCDRFLLKNKARLAPLLFKRPECFVIKIKQPDKHFHEDCMNFVRSVQVHNAECKPVPVEQMNQITSYIDASNVYGSSEDDQMGLRVGRKGLMKTIGRNLPNNTVDPDSCTTLYGSCTPCDYCFTAGDGRVNENPVLQSTHTIFVREHNRIARWLWRLNRHWTDYKIFQEARRIVGALMQVITFKEYLPILLGRNTMKKYDLNLLTRGYSRQYSYKTDSCIKNAFATAAFRMGHTMIKDTLGNRNKEYKDLGDEFLSNTFGSTSDILSHRCRNVDTFMRGLVTDCVQGVDNKMTTQVTERLFPDKHGRTMDLAALNIQRGRDHGIPAYTKWRKFCGIKQKVKDFEDLANTHRKDVIAKFKKVYKSVDDIDLFVGGISEKAGSNGLLGPTFKCLLARQFKDLKFGDRFWFEGSDKYARFSSAQLRQLRKASLSRILCDNTDTWEIQKNAFRAQKRVPCRKLPRINLRAWKEKRPKPKPKPKPKPAPKPTPTSK